MQVVGIGWIYDDLFWVVAGYDLWLKSIFCIGVYVDVSEHGATVYLYNWLFRGQSLQKFVDPVASLQCLTLAKVM